MKISSVNYLVRQGLKSIWTNRMMSFASFCIMLVSLLMVGVSVMLSINLNRIIGGIEGQSEVVVEITDNITDEDITALGENIKAIANVNTVSFYSKEEAWENMIKDMTEEEKELFQYADDNPLPDTYKVTVKDVKLMTDTTTQIDMLENVESTQSPRAFTDVLISIKRIMTVVCGAIVVALIVVCLIIISNTTRASVFARRKEINIMKYVGANNSFIRIPFFIEGMVVGVLAAGGALLLTKFAYEGVYNIFAGDFNIWNVLGVQNLYSFDELFWHVTVAYAVAGALIGAIGTSICLSRYFSVPDGQDN